MAIVMHQRQWPDAGVGVFPEYTTRNGVKVKGRIPGKYNWKSLPLSDAASSGWPANLNDDIARIMADCGTSIQANYGYPETSASEVTAADVFVNHMKYDKSVHMDWKGYYTDDEWADLLKSELHTNGAILYTADNDKAGHAFVIDGYSSEGLFHVNWGWNGAANAYYSLDNMNGDPKNPYNYDHVIIAGLKPDEGGQSIERILFYSSEEFPGVIVESRNSESGVPTMVSLGGFWNKGSESYTGKFRFGVFDREMNLVEQLWITDIEGLRPSFKVVYEDVPVEITDVDFGYSLVAQFYNNVTKEWEKVRASSEYDGVTEILLADEYSIEESTVFAYSEADDAILITTKDGVAVSCGTAAGKNVPIKEVSPNEYRINVAPLGAEVYVLRLEKGKEVVEVEFVTER